MGLKQLRVTLLPLPLVHISSCRYFLCLSLSLGLVDPPTFVAVEATNARSTPLYIIAVTLAVEICIVGGVRSLRNQSISRRISGTNLEFQRATFCISNCIANPLHSYVILNNCKTPFGLSNSFVSSSVRFVLTSPSNFELQ